ncbi:signal peptide-containing protein [Cryptosporidium canis]|uniref:Signal peptide-containing protein n=1 Tax=Cryptosporidium canis TaxID=195482 RepID=A0ABQ8P8V8_9CRYT|nr:signal peptide-containing protein [Cryptosporidium canis]KAJ1613453.1 signal peptide-containing protein [Cryptosporidium canis]
MCCKTYRLNIFLIFFLLYEVISSSNSTLQFSEEEELNVSISKIQSPIFLSEDVSKGETLIIDCKTLFESIYLDKSAEKLVNLLHFLGILDKYEELSETNDYILEYIKDEGFDHLNRKNLTLNKNTSIYFEGEYVTGNQINLGNCKVNKETGISLFNMGESLLHSAVISGRLNIVILLLLSGIDVNIKLKKDEESDLPILGSIGGYIGDLEGMTALHYTSLIQDYESIEISKLLLKFGADPNERDKYRRTPLHTVGLSRNLHPKKMASLLLDAGARINTKDSSKFTPLHVAASRNNVPVVNVLISFGSDKKEYHSIEYSVDYDGNTPLHIAAMYNSGDIIPLLIKNREDLIKGNYHGLSPLELSAFPVGFRALDTSEIPPMSFSAIQSRINSELIQDELLNKLNESYYNAIRGGYLLILKKILFTMKLDLNNMSNQIFDINKGIILAEKKGNSKISNYLKSFGFTVVCPTPPNVINSSYKLSDTVIGNNVRVGDTVTYECYDSFELIGYSTITCNLSDDVAFYIPEAPTCIEIIKNTEIPKINMKNRFHIFVLIGIAIIALLISGIVLINSWNKRQKNANYEYLYKEI